MFAMFGCQSGWADDLVRASPGTAANEVYVVVVDELVGVAMVQRRRRLNKKSNDVGSDISGWLHFSSGLEIVDRATAKFGLSDTNVTQQRQASDMSATTTFTNRCREFVRAVRATIHSDRIKILQLTRRA